MRMISATRLLLLFPLVTAGCGTAPGANDPGVASCGGTSSCQADEPPESVCLEHLAADQLDDGCGVFVTRTFGGDDANPGTKDRPVRTLQRAIALARTGRGRVFACVDGFEGSVTLPSGVDLIGGFQCLGWERNIVTAHSIISVREGSDIALTIEPASAGDTGAADGVSTISDMMLLSGSPIGMLVRAGTEVDIVRSLIHASAAWNGRRGQDGPQQRAPDGTHGNYGVDACSAAIVLGGAAVMSPCEGGVATIGGKGGDGYPDHGGAGDDGAPLPISNPSYSGTGGRGDPGDGRCYNGVAGRTGEQGADGAAGEGIGRISEAGWEGGKAGDGAPGAPGGGGGGGGGLRGGRALCGDASKGGASGGAGGAGGCGGKGGKGGGNGYPSIGILALHARVTVRDTVIQTSRAGRGGDGGLPQDGGYPSHGAPGGALADGSGRRACDGGEGGLGAPGGHGGGGRGGDSIGIAYLDEDQLVVGEGVTFTLGEPGKGGLGVLEDPTTAASDGFAAETFRFPE